MAVILCIVFGAVMMWCVVECVRQGEPVFGTTVERRDTVRVTDTITIVEPVPVSIVSTEISSRKLPMAKDLEVNEGSGIGDEGRELRDSVWVDLPISQTEYRGEDYRAWVSGFEARLDSIMIFRDKEVITLEKTIVGPPQGQKMKNKHWHIGPTIGYGYTPKGFEPFIGVSLTYSLISF